MQEPPANPLMALANSKNESVSKDEFGASKTENDALRRKLMNLKAQIGVLEQQSIKYEEVKSLVTRLIQDFQRNGDIQFVDPEFLSHPFNDSQEAIDVLRNGINRLIERHEKLAGRFELEFSKNIFNLQQQLRKKDEELLHAKEKLESAQAAKKHQKKVVSYLKYGKEVLCRTVVMRRAALIRHSETNEKEITNIQNQLENANSNLKDVEEMVKFQEQTAETLATQTVDRVTKEKNQIQSHEELLNMVDELRKTLKKEAHAHNCDLSALDVAKQNLLTLQLKIDSFFDNLKTRELLDTENENRKLQAVIKNEFNQLSHQKSIVDNKGKDIQSSIAEFTEKIAILNEQINQTEQKLQTQLMRIPDFPQLRQALDRTLAQSKKYQEEVLQRKYLLDEIGDRNRLLDQMEIQASKDRMAQLKALMPLGDGEEESEKKLPDILSERAKQQKELEELLTQPGF